MPLVQALSAVRCTVISMRDMDTPLRIVEAGELDYQTAWEEQRRIAAARAESTGPDTVLLLTHPAVYTAGKRTQPGDRPVDGTPVIDVDRGGRITWHGPGQLVGYPLVKLMHPVDVVGYVRLLEQMLIACCGDLGLLGTGRIAGRSGVWLPAGAGKPERKIAAIGVRIARGVTQHGFALNCDPDLTWYDRIVPCGISDAGVTSLSTELGRRVPVTDALPIVTRRIRQALDGEMSIEASELDRAEERSQGPSAAAGVAWHLDPALIAS